MAPLALQHEQFFTYGDYLLWEGGRWELIDGEVFDMTPAPSRQHQKISIDLAVTLHNLLRHSPCEVYAAPFDVRLPDHATKTDDHAIMTVVQPDIVVICDSVKLDDRGCLGAPDLVIEILSPHTAAKDLKSKKKLYEKHGVREYWLVHPIDKLCIVYVLGEDGQYGKDEIYADEDVLVSQAIAGVTIRLTDIFGPLEAKGNASPTT
jgi:Uma2 family endonuclease